MNKTAINTTNTTRKTTGAIARPSAKKITVNSAAHRGMQTAWQAQSSRKPAGYSYRPINKQPVEQPAPRILGLNHINITAAPELIEEVKCFYVSIIGLTVGPRARLDHDGYWLYAGSSPILHLSARTGLVEKDEQRGYFNHVSLSCVGLSGAIAKMKATGTPYRLATVLDTGQTQLFVQDPAGIDVELTFFNEFLTPSETSR